MKDDGTTTAQDIAEALKKVFPKNDIAYHSTAVAFVYDGLYYARFRLAIDGMWYDLGEPTILKGNGRTSTRTKPGHTYEVPSLTS